MDVKEYIEKIEESKKETFLKIREVILNNLPDGYIEEMSYGMIGFVVPHTIYPAGYHCDPKLPLPFMSLAAQKNSINFYHMGIYADVKLYDWFLSEYNQFSTKKLDMGKSCMRFKNTKDVPFELIGQLVKKISIQNWINTYELNYKKK
jgi:hypothetical protein